MGASAKATGGKKIRTAKAPSARGSARGSAPRLPKPPQGHGGYKRKVTRKPPRREGEAPHYTNLNARELMLAAARDAAEDRGYEAMRVSEVTDAVGVTRQAFYAHFRDKRHCMAEVVDPKLAAIERMAASASEQDVEWPGQIAHVIDDVISEHFGSVEGTRGRLVSAMIELLRVEGSFHKVKIGALVRAAHVPPGDFYRQFSGKGECFAVAYEQLLEDLTAEVRQECPAEHTRHDVPTLLCSLAEALNSDPDRRRILIVEMAHLPDSAPDDVEGARKPALRQAIAGLLGNADDASLRFAASSVVEVIRSAELAGEPEGVGRRLADLAGSSALSLSGPSESRLAA